MSELKPRPKHSRKGGSRDKPNNDHVPLGRCVTCQKVVFDSKARAKAYVKHRGLDITLRPYSCPEHPGWYHLGHLAPAVIRGNITRDVRYAEGGPSRSAWSQQREQARLPVQPIPPDSIEEQS